jgi:hypothetical protein
MFFHFMLLINVDKRNVKIFYKNKIFSPYARINNNFIFSTKGEVSPSLQPLRVFRFPLCGGLGPPQPPRLIVLALPTCLNKVRVRCLIVIPAKARISAPKEFVRE